MRRTVSMQGGIASSNRDDTGPKRKVEEKKDLTECRHYRKEGLPKRKIIPKRLPKGKISPKVKRLPKRKIRPKRKITEKKDSRSEGRMVKGERRGFIILLTNTTPLSLRLDRVR